MAEEAKKVKKLGKDITGTIVTITEGETGTSLKYDFSKLPDAIKANLGPFGLGHKLGDAAAGKKGKDAIDAINKVYDGLLKGDWSVRAPAAEKVTTKSIMEKFNALAPAEQAKIRPTLVAMGLLKG